MLNETETSRVAAGAQGWDLGVGGIWEAQSPGCLVGPWDARGEGHSCGTAGTAAAAGRREGGEGAVMKKGISNISSGKKQLSGGVMRG